jgi:hypothetical protein
MKTNLTVAIVFASLLTAGGSALAASRHHNIVMEPYAASDQYDGAYNQSGAYDRSYAAPYGAPNAVPFDAYASSAPGWGRSDVSSSQPSFNPSLDRAKGAF